jgi:hypothetical protein
MDTVLPQSKDEKNKDKQLHDMVQKYSSGEISPSTLGFKYQARIMSLSPYLHVYICFKLLK